MYFVYTLKTISLFTHFSRSCLCFFCLSSVCLFISSALSSNLIWRIKSIQPCTTSELAIKSYTKHVHTLLNDTREFPAWFGHLILSQFSELIQFENQLRSDCQWTKPLGIDVSPTSLQQWSTLLFLLTFIMYKHIALNTIYYHSHTFSLTIYNFSIMYTAWCLTLYLNPIYCWALSIYNYLNLLPIPL